LSRHFIRPVGIEGYQNRAGLHKLGRQQNDLIVPFIEVWVSFFKRGMPSLAHPNHSIPICGKLIKRNQ
jgi:hypothetical protein